MVSKTVFLLQDSSTYTSSLAIPGYIWRKCVIHRKRFTVIVHEISANTITDIPYLTQPDKLTVEKHTSLSQSLIYQVRLNKFGPIQWLGISVQALLISQGLSAFGKLRRNYLCLFGVSPALQR